MCGRYVAPDIRAIEREWELLHRSGGGAGWEEGLYNAAPTRQLPVVSSVEGKHVAQAMRWGFVPQWWKDEKLPNHATNARIEPVVGKPMWRTAIRQTRVLVPARGYYEWAKQVGTKQPYFIRLPDEPLICFAGLWSSWRDTLSFTILVGPAAPHLAHIHDRMPLTLPRSAWGGWLNPEQQDGAAALTQAQSAALSNFKPVAVSTYVNNSRNEGPRCIEPIGKDEEEPGASAGGGVNARKAPLPVAGTSGSTKIAISAEAGQQTGLGPKRSGEQDRLA
jgi:putative SOS response-associated peptidase YedK